MDIKKARKLHNPKSHSPAVYIPCWLIQVPSKLLSHGAKLVYGRLSQWASEYCQVFRSVPQLAKELGMCESSVEKFQKELKDCDLIGTYHPQAGGVNHFEFYDHPWMHDPINKELVYKSEDPPYKHTVPPVSSYGTPPYKHTDINKKEIKETTTTSSSSIFEQYKTQELRQLQSASDAIDKDKKILGFKQEALNDEKCITIFTERFAGFEVTLEELYDECCAYWSQKNQLVYKQRFYTHLSKAPLSNYSQKKISKSEFQVPTAEFERIQNEAGERKRKERYEKFLQNQKV